MYLLSSRLKETLFTLSYTSNNMRGVRPPHGSSLSVDLMSIEGIGEGGVDVGVLPCRAVVPHEAGVVFWLHAIQLQVQPLHVRSTLPPGVRQDPVQGHDVAEGHLQRFILGEFFVLAPLWDHFTQAVEGRVQTLHPLPLPGIGRHPTSRGGFEFLRRLGLRFRGLGSRVGAALSTRLHGGFEMVCKS